MSQRGGGRSVVRQVALRAGDELRIGRKLLGEVVAGCQWGISRDRVLHPDAARYFRVQRPCAVGAAARRGTQQRPPHRCVRGHREVDRQTQTSERALEALHEEYPGSSRRSAPSGTPSQSTTVTWEPPVRASRCAKSSAHASARSSSTTSIRATTGRRGAWPVRQADQRPFGVEAQQRRARGDQAAGAGDARERGVGSGGHGHTVDARTAVAQVQSTDLWTVVLRRPRPRRPRWPSIGRRERRQGPRPRPGVRGARRPGATSC